MAKTRGSTGGKSPKKTPKAGGSATRVDRRKLKPIFLTRDAESETSDNEIGAGNETPDSDEELTAARCKLSQALAKIARGDDAPSGEEEETDQSMSPPSKLRRKTLLQKIGKSPAEVAKPTFNVSFFDRTVDLAPFVMESSSYGDNMSLYPICRGWLRDGRPSDVATLRNHLKEEGVDAERGMESGVRRLPNPQPIRRDRVSRERSVRIPKNTARPVVNVYEIDEAINSCPDDSVPNLLLTNIEKWRTIRNDWKQASIENEQRYQHSCNVLKAMYEKSMAQQQIEPKIEPLDTFSP